MPMPAVTRVALFLDDGHLDFGAHVGVELDPDPELAQLADRLGEIHLALVHLDPKLLELALHVARRDRAIQLVLLADFDGEAEPDLGDARGLGLGGALLVGALPGEPAASSRTVGSKAGYRPGATSITRRMAPLASRVASH